MPLQGDAVRVHTLVSSISGENDLPKIALSAVEQWKDPTPEPLCITEGKRQPQSRQNWRRRDSVAGRKDNYKDSGNKYRRKDRRAIQEHKVRENEQASNLDEGLRMFDQGQ